MKIKHTILASFVLVGSTICNAQNTILTTGGSVTNASGSVSYSVGQIDYASASVSNKGSISLGVQQPLIISVLTGIKGSEKLTIACQMYPNPSSDFVVLSWETGLDATSVNYKITDINGKNIVSASAQNQFKISVLDLAQGTYIINISDSKNNFIKSFK